MSTDAYNANHEPDPQTRFAIPNERDLRKRIPSKSLSGDSRRKIKFVWDGAEVRLATDLPFNAPGLQWQGRPAMTTRQLQAQSEGHIADQRKKAKAAKDAVTEDHA